jgi:hypothetical protein
VQYKGTLQLEDFASHSEPEEYIFTITADTVGEADKRVSGLLMNQWQHCSNTLTSDVITHSLSYCMQVMFRGVDVCRSTHTVTL